MRTSRTTARKPGRAKLPPGIADLAPHALQAADLLKALANHRRLLILCLLADGERSVSEINALVDLSQSALSQHLALLREEGLVTTRRDAQSIYYALTEGPVREIIGVLRRTYCGAG